VTEVIGKRLENSAVLVLLAAVISTPLSIALGAVAARRRDRPFDHATSVVMLALAAVPEFAVGIVLVVLFGTTVFTWLPAVSLIPPEDSPWQHVNTLVLPTLTLIVAVAPYTARIMRASMVDVLESDYVEMARLKGLKEQRVVWRHAVPNAIAPTIQATALNLAYLAGGIVAVEYVFGYPGIGSALVDAVHNRDVPVVQALAMLIATVYIVLNVLADVAAILVSPRLRTSLQ
jgi:peptide/nickel transport system permease protein